MYHEAYCALGKNCLPILSLEQPLELTGEPHSENMGVLILHKLSKMWICLSSHLLVLSLYYLLAKQNEAGEGYVAFIALCKAYLDCWEKKEDHGPSG